MVAAHDSFDNHMRETLMALADVLLPADDRMLAASHVDTDGSGWTGSWRCGPT